MTSVILSRYKKAIEAKKAKSTSKDKFGPKGAQNFASAAQVGLYAVHTSGVLSRWLVAGLYWEPSALLTSVVQTI